MTGPSPPLGSLLRTFRIRTGLSQEALAEASGVSVRTVSDLERGQRATAHLETARMLADALDLTRDERRLLLESARFGGVSADARPVAPALTVVGTPRWSAPIPAPATPLVGRASELDALTALLAARTGEIVTLTGPGGVGKTRLAIEVAHRVAPALADGAAFVELATVTQPELVPDAIARALGMTPPKRASADQLLTLLASRELLLVLDNVEQVIDSAPFIAELSAACPRLTVLVTSRVRLRVSSEREMVVPPLSLAEDHAPLEQRLSSAAIQLFGERARRADPQFELSEQNVATVAEICRRVDGLPLAIELAAARLRILPAPVLLERLNRRLPLLTGGDRDRPARQQSMRETIAWSYELLDPAAKHALRWMSVFAGGLSLDAAEALGAELGLDSDASLEAVTTLVEYGLARSEPAGGQQRFHLFETIREFGLEQLGAAGELDRARRFHAEHFLELASRDAPRPDEPIPVAWVGRLAAEHANLIQAYDVLCVPDTAEQGLRFAAAMGPYWHTHGPFSEWEPRANRALELASPEPTILHAHALFWSTLIQGASPDFSRALQTAKQYVAMSEAVGTTSDRAAAIGAMAWVYECHEQWEIARELRNQAIELLASVGNRYMQAICLAMNGISAYALGELDRARREAEQALALFRAVGALDWSASTGCTLGLFAVTEGRLDLGAKHYTESLRIWIESESVSRWYRPLVGLADVASQIGQFEAAARLLGAADAMRIAGGRDLLLIDRPGYARAETHSREALGSDAFDELRISGHRLTSAEWLVEADAIVEAARATAPASTE